MILHSLAVTVQQEDPLIVNIIWLKMLFPCSNFVFGVQNKP